MLEKAESIFSASSQETISWEDFCVWAETLKEDSSPHQLLGGMFMEYHAPKLVVHLLNGTQTLNYYRRDPLATLPGLEDQLRYAISSLNSDAGVRVAQGKRKRWVAKPLIELYLEALHHKWETDAWGKAFELCACSLLGVNLKRSSMRDYVELGVGMMLAQNFTSR